MRFNPAFLKFLLVISLIFWGSFIDSDFISTIGVSLVFFWLGRRLINGRAAQHNRLPYLACWGLICSLLPINHIDFFANLTGFTLLVWTGYAVTNRFGRPRQARLATSSTKKPAITTTLASWKKAVSDRPDKASKTSPQPIQSEVKPSPSTNQPELTEQAALTQLAALSPDLVESVQEIFDDSRTIRRLLEQGTASNRTELLTLADTNRQRFDKVLNGYLSIKQHPHHYHEADQRLLAAEAAIRQFAQELKHQVRQLHEDQMHAFEVNLRLLNQDH